MSLVTKWIQERKVYSNPLFGAILILSGMIFPVFHAAAQIEEPVQPMAQTAEQVADALKAVDAGVSVEHAFLEQQAPHRYWASLQNKIYESLFGVSYEPQDAIYHLNDEISMLDEQSSVTGATVLGDGFSLFLGMLVEYDYANDPEMSADAISAYNNISLSWHIFTGSLSTDLATEHVSGFIFQATDSDGVRARALFILDKADQETIDNINIMCSQPAAPEGDQPAGPPQDCEEAYTRANEAYNTAIRIAGSTYRGCKDDVNGIMNGGSLACIGIGLLTAFFTAGTTGFVAWGTCMALVIGAAITKLDSCRNANNTAFRNAEIARDAARAQARRIFGVENCPETQE